MFARYHAEMDAIMGRWRRLGTTLGDNAQRIQELMAKLMQFEVGWIKEIMRCTGSLRAQPKYQLRVNSTMYSSFFPERC